MTVGVVVKRAKAESPWIEFLWRPVAILAGEPDTPPWSVLSSDDETTLFYGGCAEIKLYRSETANYRNNLLGEASLWVVLRPTESEPPYQVFAVTADPAEGEAYTEAGSDLVETVPMPDLVRDFVAAFVAENVEYEAEYRFVKRKRDRANPEALARRGPIREDKNE
ncbi:MAG: DUF3305 domain-containing protein [Rhizobiales bacterium]|nr:DUF3305 domain-containing protein [Hyphomicrobiales bacterium]